MRRKNSFVGSWSEGLESRQLFAAASAGGWSALVTMPAAKGLSSDLSLDTFKPYTLNAASIGRSLARAPVEDVAKFGVGLGAGSRLISVPTPAGTYARFRVVESAVMDPKLAAKFPDIKTYAGVGVDDPAASIRLDLTPLGFHAQVLTPTGNGAYYVDPYYHNDAGVYASYYASASSARGAALADDVVQTAAAAADGVAARTSGTQLRTYRTAVATTGEYTAYFGGTVAAGQAAIVTAINRVTGIYETELSIRLVLVANNSSLVYTNASTDPYTNTDPDSLLTQNQSTVDSVIGTGNYDIGHVFSTAGGGLADLGVVGISGYKAQGETGTSAPVGDAFYVDYVAHEMGHQFGADHTFNTANDTSNRNATTAFEPGSGSTIMAYAGIEGPATSGGVTGTEDLQAHSDPYFAFVSLNQIITYVDGSIPTVGTRTSTGNGIPTATFTTTAYTIPANTPFTLTSPTATDANGDTVYYSWEEADAGAARYLTQADNGSSPLFRVYNPTTSPSRTFPQLASILNGTNITYVSGSTTSRAEQLPTTNRTLKFVLTLRDRKAGGGGTNVLSGTGTGVSTATITPTMTVASVAAASTFAVSTFNTATTVAGGSTQTITWNVAGTTGNGINTANVQILMSTDGGQTFPTVLASSTANDGSEAVVIPNPAGTQSAVRFKVAAVGNVYFDINNADVTVTPTATSVSATPGAPDLLAATDSGVSNTDNLTNFNNSGSAKALQFSVAGTVSGATVTLYAAGGATPIGSAVATGTTTTVTTNGTTALADGVSTITARQTESGKTISAAGGGLNVTIDTVAPTVTGTPTFSYLTGGPKVTFATSEAVGALTLPQFFSAYNATTAAYVPTANLATSANGSTVTLSFNGVSGAPSATTLPNGNYTAVASAGAFTDAAGNANANSGTTTFFWLNGDADRNRVVDFNDFLALQNNYNGTGKTYAQGDFDADGDVDFNDFLVLQNNYNATV